MTAWIPGDSTPVPEPEGDCLNDDTLAALADGTLDTPERAIALAHVATCATCRARLASLTRALANPEVIKETVRLEKPRRAWIRVAVPLAIAAALLLSFLPRDLLRRQPGVEHRAPPTTFTAGSAPTGLYPAGRVASVTHFTWSPVARADRYRAFIFDAEGRALFEPVTVDTLVPLPDSVFLEPRRRYFWRVEARLDVDRWASSDLVEFEVAAGRSP